MMSGKLIDGFSDRLGLGRANEGIDVRTGWVLSETNFRSVQEWEMQMDGLVESCAWLRGEIGAAEGLADRQSQIRKIVEAEKTLIGPPDVGNHMDICFFFLEA